MKFFCMLTAVLLAVSLVSLHTAGATAEGGARKDVLYYCNCGDGCNCNSVSKTPGNCNCGKEMAGGHILKVEGVAAIVCACGPDCKCELSADDPSKCACGKPVNKVSLKGTGIYFCNCGGSCKCNTASDMPGDCGCGMKLKKVD